VLESERGNLKRMFGAGPGCLRVEQLSGLVDGSLDAAGTALAHDHVSRCAYCRNELALLNEFRSAQPRADEVASLEWMGSELDRRMAGAFKQSERRKGPSLSSVKLGDFFSIFSWRGFALAAASLMVAAIVGNYYWRPAGPGRPVVTRGSEVWRSSQVIVLTPIGDVEKAPSELKWQPINGAARYQVRLLEVDRSEIWRAESGVPEQTLPVELRAKMVPGRTFLWEVSAFDRAGRKVAGSNLQQFYISRTR
jgi:hypothetical protein